MIKLLRLAVVVLLALGSFASSMEGEDVLLESVPVAAAAAHEVSNKTHQSNETVIEPVTVSPAAHFCLDFNPNTVTDPLIPPPHTYPALAFLAFIVSKIPVPFSSFERLHDECRGGQEKIIFQFTFFFSFSFSLRRFVIRFLARTRPRGPWGSWSTKSTSLSSRRPRYIIASILVSKFLS